MLDWRIVVSKSIFLFKSKKIVQINSFYNLKNINMNKLPEILSRNVLKAIFEVCKIEITVHLMETDNILGFQAETFENVSKSCGRLGSSRPHLIMDL